MDKTFLYQFMSRHKYAVVSTVSPENIPESACVGIAVNPDLKIIFDTVSDSRKYRNLLLNPHIALVIWEGEQTVQYEGIVRTPKSPELEELLQTYFTVFPDGKERKENWPDTVYCVIEPQWIRYSDFDASSYKVSEMSFPQ